MVCTGELCIVHARIPKLTLVQSGVSCKWTNDSQRLLLEHFDAISSSPCQIYHSALPLSPSSSWLHNHYATELSKEVRVVQGLPARWGACFRTVVTHTRPVCSICWKNTVAVGLLSGDIAILDGTTGSQVATLSGHTGNVSSLAVSSDGALFVSGSYDRTIKQWDLQTGGVIRTLHGHTEIVHSVSISADHTTIASGSSDATLRLWDVHTGECHHIIEQEDEVKCVSFSPTDPQHLIFTFRSVQQWEISGNGINHKYNGYHATFSPDGTQFASCVKLPGTVVVQNTSSGAIVAEFPLVSDANVQCCCFSPDGRLIAVAPDNAIQIWDITGSDPQLIETFVGHSDIIWSIGFFNSSSLISSSRDGSVKFWQMTVLTDQVGTYPKTVSLVSSPTRSITLQAEDGITISSDSDGVVKIQDLSTGSCKASFQTPAKDVNHSDVRLIGNRLIFVWFADEKIHVYDVEKGELLHTVDGPRQGVIDIRISGDGSKVLCLVHTYIQAWSIWTGEAVGEVLSGMVSPQSFIVGGSRAWFFCSLGRIWRGWNFGIANSRLGSSSNSPSLSLNDTKQWDLGLSRVRDTVTGQLIFQMGGRHTHPFNVQSGGKYVALYYTSGEVLVLDFNHVFP